MGVIVSPQSSFGTVVKKVPFIEGAEVTFAEDISAELWQYFRSVLSGKQKDESIGERMFKAIVLDWNFFYKNEQGEEVKVPLTDEGLNKYISKRTQDWITEEIMAFFGKRESQK